MSKKQPKALFYDLETSPLKAWIWRLGDNTIRHAQLCKAQFSYQILTITYCFNDGGPVKVLDWTDPDMLSKFDEIIQSADITIGKNSDRFDVKHLNTQRMLAGNEGIPQWAMYTEDLEKQLRKHFALPSFSLDYVSELLGLGGKRKMEFQDWIDIVEYQTVLKLQEHLCPDQLMEVVPIICGRDYIDILKAGPVKQKKMNTYGQKDTADTRKIWNYCLKHFTPKYNAGTFNQDGALRCKVCGSDDLQKRGIRYAKTGEFQEFTCKSGARTQSHTYAGRAKISRDEDGEIKKYGKVQ